MSFHPDQPWLDDHGVHLNAHGAGALYHDGAYYLFGEHKIGGRLGNSAQVGVHVYSSTDLERWTDRGIALAVVDDESSDITRGCVIERPKVLYNARTGKFVMWFHLELKGQGYHAARTACAVADAPAGPYRFLRSLRPNAGVWPVGFPPDSDGEDSVVKGMHVRRDFAGGQMARDMTLFQDDDARGYLICASEENYTLHIHELTDDYLDFTGRYVRVLPGEHNEAPAICKHNGKYHLLSSGCTGWDPNAARAAVADSIWGPWTPVGNPCEGVNPRSGMGPELTFGGQSTFILPVQGRPGTFIAMFDVWRPKNPIDGGYIWLPIEFENDRMVIRWRDEWSL